MFRFLLILILVFYLIYKIGGFIFRVLFLGALQSKHQQQQSQYKQQSHRKAPDSNLNIDYIPGEKKNQSNDFKSGDYVDYEEVK